MDWIDNLSNYMDIWILYGYIDIYIYIYIYIYMGNLVYNTYIYKAMMPYRMIFVCKTVLHE